eukprot:gene16810-18506_t
MEDSDVGSEECCFENTLLRSDKRIIVKNGVQNTQACHCPRRLFVLKKTLIGQIWSGQGKAPVVREINTSESGSPVRTIDNEPIDFYSMRAFNDPNNIKPEFKHRS